ncbi:DUF4214 domain-containing protein [Pseudoduganella sp. FT93W]|uniref:DUF4214 domain-containing protein n=1 Tax=Duganella fentianensis TaxID=2692177 RepID=A0A845HWU6_9BURK|nr:DUF4214 domain-containing protein [Duganella fentianensis]MYN44001.1 DUF4214 domain-containing protein [Duganella fentianensis]
MATTTELVQQLYVAYYNRPADVAGLAFWVDAIDNRGATIDQVSKGFNTVKEYTDMYSGKTADAVVNTVYQNLFGRIADSEGLNFWGPKIQSGAITTADLVKYITAGAVNADGTPNADGQVFANKVAAAQAFTTEIGTAGNEAERVAYANGGNAVAVAKAYIAGVTTTASLTAALANVHAVAQSALPAPEVTNFTLKATVDDVLGTAGNDVITAVIDGTTNAVATTLTPLDTINGGAGNDTVVLNVLNGVGNAGTAVAALPAVTVSNVENLNIRSAVDLTANTSSWSGLTNVNLTQGAVVALTSGATTAVAVSGATGNVSVTGGSTQTVTSAASGTAVTLGSAAGAVAVTHTAQAGGNIGINNGTTVDVTASGATTGTVIIGNTTAASGAVNVNTTGAAYAAADTAAVRGLITITGGTTVNVKQTATSSDAKVAADTSAVGNGVTQSAVTVHANNSTTAVTVAQTAAATAVDAVIAAAGAKQVDTVTFTAMAANDSITVGGLTFTASKALTAAQAAAAFANLASGVTTGAAPAANGIYSGTFVSTYTTGAVVTTGSVVTVDATAKTAANGNTPISFSESVAAANPSVANKTAGVVSADAVTGVLGVANGTVTIDSAAVTGTAKLATVSLDGYGAATVASDALTSLNLAHSASTVGVTNAAATTLALGLNSVTGAINLGSTYTALNVTTSGDDSASAVTAGGVQALTITGTQAVDLSGSTLGALKTVTVSGSAGVTINASGSNVTAVNTSATTGKAVVSIDATKATYTGGAGVDVVTLTTTAPTKAVSLGAGDDTLVLATGTTSATVTLDGGAGTDILSMAAADAASASSTSAFADRITGFEKLKVGAAGAATTVDLANMDAINYVISAGATGTKEVFVATFSADTTAGHLSFDGIDFTGVVAGTAAATAGAFVTYYNAQAGANWVAVDNTDGTVTFTAKVAGAVTDILSAAFSTHGMGADVTVTAAAPTTQGADANPANTLTLTHFANNGTVELIGAAATTTVTLNDATGTSDSLNIITKVGTANLDFGTVAAAGVETLNITATDTDTSTSTGNGVQTATLAVTDAAAKSIVITGTSALTLSLNAANTAVTSIDGSAMSAKLIAATVAGAAAAATVKGGAGADQLTANHIGDTLIGGAGNDTLIVNAGLVTLTGGAGADTFDVSTATSNSNSYATITDISAGDKITFNSAAVNFLASKVTLANTAVFQDYANEAIKLSSDGQVSWFQYNGDTYIVENATGASTTQFTNGTDIIVKLTGIVDLSTASFSSSTHTVLIG